MNMKTVLTALALVLAFASPAMAQEADTTPESATTENIDTPLPWGGLSLTFGGTNDYRFRGISQTDERASLQGSLDWNNNTGLYAGVFVSNVDFLDGGEANLEARGYGGYKFEMMGMSLDVGMTGYFYPGADANLEYDYYEGKIDLGYSTFFGDLNLMTAYTPENFGNSGASTYSEFGMRLPMGKSGAYFTGTWGYRWIDNDAAFGQPDYSNWSLGVGYTLKGFDVAAKYVDTSLSSTDCPNGGCDAAAVVTVTRRFP